MNLKRKNRQHLRLKNGRASRTFRGQKVLIVYFSHTGNTRTIAGYIHDTVKSDLVEIQNGRYLYRWLWYFAGTIREEVASGYCPPLTTNIENLFVWRDIHRLSYLGGNSRTSHPHVLTTWPRGKTLSFRSARAGPALPRQATGLSVPFARNQLYWRAYRFVGNVWHSLWTGYRMVAGNRYCRTE